MTKRLTKGLLMGSVIAISSILSGCMGAKYYLKRGEAEYQRQDYHQSFSDTLAAAKLGNVDAQYATGYMYYYGTGTEQSDYLAGYWFDQAARVGDPRATAALEQIKQRAPYPFIFGLSKQQTAPSTFTPPPAKPGPKNTKPYTTYQTTPKQQATTAAHKKTYTTYKTTKKQPVPDLPANEHLPSPHSTYVK